MFIYIIIYIVSCLSNTANNNPQESACTATKHSSASVTRERMAKLTTIGTAALCTRNVGRRSEMNCNGNYNWKAI